MTNLPAIRLSQHSVARTVAEAERIRPLVRVQSVTLTTACRQAGLPIDLAELCGGLLASVVDDMVAIGQLGHCDFERSKRMERVLAATDEPALFALRCAIAASPINGRAAVRHWDAICDKHERGRFAWLLNMDTDNAHAYGKKMEQRANS